LGALVVASDACTCVVNPPNGPAGPGEGGGAGAAGAGGAGGGRPDGALPVGCRGDDCKVPPLPSLRPPQCPVGSSCDVGNGNGRGVYIAREGAYCMVDESTQGFSLCPERFVTSPAGVALVLRDPRAPAATRQARVAASWVEPGGQERPVQLQGLRAEKTELYARFLDNGAQREANGHELKALRLRAVLAVDDAAPRFDVTIAIEPAPPQLSRAVRRYVLTYRPTGSNGPFRRHCGVGGEALATSFLGGMRIDGLTARVDDDSSATTVSCETGAIDACLDLGYAPWAPRAGSAAAGTYLFATCLQAKRAAYFVRFGDTGSYTVNGTSIFWRDPFGIRAEPAHPPDGSWVNGLEAIWSPEGAECLNPDHRRRMELPVPAHALPRCDPARWTAAGKIAITPAARPPGGP
jgi:hypothetical protein